MQVLNYIQYFFYLAFNWNFRIAIHILKNETRGENKYGIHTTGADELKSLEKKGIDISNATIYMPAGYDILETVFKAIEKYNLKHLLDIGCGKGRAMCVAAHYHFDKLTGIDFSKAFCEAAERNLEHTKREFPGLSYRIINNDAFYYETPADVDCIFFFNPFNEMVMRAVITNIERSLEQFPRDLYIIYLNPLNKHLFLENGYEEIYHVQKMKYLEAAVYKKR